MGKKTAARLHVENLNMEIDYDKLAAAIVKAERKAKSEEHEADFSNVKVGFLKAAWEIICNKNKTDGRLTTGLLSLMVSLFLNAMAIIGFLIFSIGIVVAIEHLSKMVWTYGLFVQNILSLAIIGAILILIALMSLMLRGAANEIERESDNNYIVSIFAGISSFLAMIFALLSLFKGGA